MRLDKMITSTGTASRSQVSRAARDGRVTVNGVTVRRAETQVDPDRDSVIYCGQEIVYRKYTYIMLNKPEGYVSATEDELSSPPVTKLLPEDLQRIGLFPCGRLDKNTVGLMLLTNNGELSHKLLLPRTHVTKSYAYTVKFSLNSEDIEKLEAGVDIGGYITKPCRVFPDSENSGIIEITEGKYHQIKLMMEAVHNQITFLERRSFGNLSLDISLARGEWRFLTEDETDGLKACCEKIYKGDIL